MEILYKYRSWSNEFHRSSLKMNKIYAASPSDFNDPFDCRIQKNYKVLTDEKLRKKYIDHRILMMLNSGLTQEEVVKVIAAIDHEIKNSIETYNDSQQRVDAIVLDSLYGIYSLSKRWNSILMWSHYANNHKGFAIGYNKKKLIESKLFNYSGDVIYSEEYPKFDIINVDNSENLKKLTQYKASDWQYEQEFRLIKLLKPGKKCRGDRIIILPKDCIEEVLLGERISDNSRDEIIEHCNKSNIKVFDIKKIDYKFKLRKLEI